MPEIKNQMKMTNDELSERTGIPGGTLSKILAGISEDPKLSNFVAICQALNCSLDYVMYGIEENSNNYTLADDEIEMVERFRVLDARGKETVLAALERESAYADPSGKVVAAPARIVRPEPLQKRLAAAYANNDNGFAKLDLPIYDLPVSAGTGVYLFDTVATDIAIPDNGRTADADYALRISGDSMEPKYHDRDVLLVQECEQIEPGELGIFVLDGEGYFKKYGGDCLISLNPFYAPIMLRDFNDIRCCGRVIGKLHKK